MFIISSLGDVVYRARYTLYTVLLAISNIWGKTNVITSRDSRVGPEAMLNGSAGQHQEYLSVYARAGEQRPRCSYTVERIVQGQHSTYFCPVCLASPESQEIHFKHG